MVFQKRVKKKRNGAMILLQWEKFAKYPTTSYWHGYGRCTVLE